MPVTQAVSRLSLHSGGEDISMGVEDTAISGPAPTTATNIEEATPGHSAGRHRSSLGTGSFPREKDTEEPRGVGAAEPMSTQWTDQPALPPPAAENVHGDGDAAPTFGFIGDLTQRVQGRAAASGGRINGEPSSSVGQSSQSPGAVTVDPTTSEEWFVDMRNTFAGEVRMLNAHAEHLAEIHNSLDGRLGELRGTSQRLGSIRLAVEDLEERVGRIEAALVADHQAVSVALNQTVRASHTVAHMLTKMQDALDAARQARAAEGAGLEGQQR